MQEGRHRSAKLVPLYGSHLGPSKTEQQGRLYRISSRDGTGKRRTFSGYTSFKVCLRFLPSEGGQRAITRQQTVVHQFICSQHCLGFGEVVGQFSSVGFGLATV